MEKKEKKEPFCPPISVQMLLRLMGIEERLILDPYHCKREVKKVIKGNIEKPSKKKVKVKELMDSIKDGRKKFKELMGVYEGKIKKL